MSIKKTEIKLHSQTDKNKLTGKTTTYIEASIILRNRYELSDMQALRMSVDEDDDMIVNIKKTLIESFLHYIYGDLLGPINDLAILAQHHLTGMNDADELLELRTTIHNIIKGNEHE